MRALAALLLSTFAACWSPRYFAPREYVGATSPDGSPAALYQVPGAAGAVSSAEVRVWSRGASAEFAADSREVVEVHVGFEVENNGEEPLQLDLGTVVLEAMTIDGVLQPPLSPLRIVGDGTAAPRTTARVDLWYEPAAPKPRAVDAFSVRFVLRAGDRVALQQVTPFGAWTYAAYYDPYWSSWGWSWGWGFSGGVACHHHH